MKTLKQHIEEKLIINKDSYFFNEDEFINVIKKTIDFDYLYSNVGCVMKDSITSIKNWLTRKLNDLIHIENHSDMLERFNNFDIIYIIENDKQLLNSGMKDFIDNELNKFKSNIEEFKEKFYGCLFILESEKVCLMMLEHHNSTIYYLLIKSKYFEDCYKKH